MAVLGKQGVLYTGEGEDERRTRNLDTVGPEGRKVEFNKIQSNSIRANARTLILKKNMFITNT